MRPGHAWPGLTRRAALLLLPLGAAACTGRREVSAPAPPPRKVQPQTFEPLTYDYLTPIGLNVASIEVVQRFVPGQAGGDMVSVDPVRPSDAIARMARDRLQALGTSGRAVLAVNDASIVQRGGSYDGSLAVELDIFTAANERAAFVEARVSAQQSVDSGEDVRTSLYQLTKKMMDQLNIEFEYQVRRALKAWLVTAPAADTASVAGPAPIAGPAPVAGSAPVEEQALPPPSR